MVTQQIELKDVKTPADVNRIFTEQCTTLGLQVSLFSYIFGVIGVPLALKNFHKRVPFGIEYKLAIGAFSAMALSYFAGTYAKNRCERDLKKQVQAQLMA